MIFSIRWKETLYIDIICISWYNMIYKHYILIKYNINIAPTNYPGYMRHSFRQRKKRKIIEEASKKTLYTAAWGKYELQHSTRNRSAGEADGITPDSPSAASDSFLFPPSRLLAASVRERLELHHPSCLMPRPLFLANTLVTYYLPGQVATTLSPSLCGGNIKRSRGTVCSTLLNHVLAAAWSPPLSLPFSSLVSFLSFSRFVFFSM